MNEILIGGVSVDHLDHVVFEPAHVFGKGEAHVAKLEHLSVDHLVLDLVVEPLHICGVSELVQASLNQHGGDIEILEGNLGRGRLSVMLSITDSTVVKLIKVIRNGGLSEVSQVLEG